MTRVENTDGYVRRTTASALNRSSQAAIGRKPIKLTNGAVTDADTIGIFVNLYQPLEVAQKVPFADVPGYDPSMGDLGSTIGPVRLSQKDVIVAFPDLPVYGFAGTEIVKIGIDAATLCA